MSSPSICVCDGGMLHVMYDGRMLGKRTRGCRLIQLVHDIVSKDHLRQTACQESSGHVFSTTVQDGQSV